MASTNLVKQPLRTMMMTKLKMAGAVAFLPAYSHVSLPEWLRSTPRHPADPRTRQFSSITKAPRPVRLARQSMARNHGTRRRRADVLVFHGRVLRPDGKPAAGGCVVPARASTHQSITTDLKTKTGPDGRFRFNLARSDVDAALAVGPSRRSPFWPPRRISDLIGLRFPSRLSRSYRCDWSKTTCRSRAGFLDLEGKPVVGAKIKRGPIKADGAVGIERYLKQIRDDPMRASNHNFAQHYWFCIAPANRRPSRPMPRAGSA